MALPIFKNLLIHTVEYRRITKNDGDGTEFEDYVIKNVRVVKDSTFNRSGTLTFSDNETTGTRVIIDIIHSIYTKDGLPAPKLIPREQDKFTFDGVRYSVKKVQTRDTLSPNHHITCLLV